jgi:SulP family sulfate permease
VYYIPSHVLVGCIGGIGLFIAKTGMEVTINEVFSRLLSRADLVPLWSVVLVFEIILRLLERWTTNHVTGKAQSSCRPFTFAR